MNQVFLIKMSTNHLKVKSKPDYLKCISRVAVPCDPSAFHCVSDGICLDSKTRCDQRRDCPDNSDENDCGTVGLSIDLLVALMGD